MMPQFSSEPRFEPEPAEPNSKFSSRFRELPEPNLGQKLVNNVEIS